MNKKIVQLTSVRWLGLVLVCTVVAGLIAFGMSRAVSTGNQPVEAENGQLAGAENVTDSSASGGGAIQFGGFTHPGILLGKQQLDFVKNRLAANQDPWKTAYSRMLTDKAVLGTNDGMPYTSLSYEPHPVAHIRCPAGPATSAPASCSDETNDAIAAYADTLVWYYDHNVANRDAYAQKAIEILNAWSGTLVDHDFDINDPDTLNGPLQASWAGQVFPRSAEILRYEYTPPAGETALNISQFTSMLNNAFLPHVNQNWYGGGANWLMSFDEATINIAIFTDNRTVFNQAVDRWREDVPSIIYMSSDVNPYPQLAGYPIPAPDTMYDKPTTTPATMNDHWHDPTSYIDGLEGETCRDPAHMAMGLDFMVNVAETARLQGVDLYSEQKTRITTSIELNAGYLLDVLAGNSPSNWVCSSPMADPQSNAGWKLAFEVAYNGFANRMGIPMPNTWQLLTQYSRPSVFDAFQGMDFEELTSAGTP